MSEENAGNSEDVGVFRVFQGSGTAGLSVEQRQLRGTDRRPACGPDQFHSSEPNEQDRAGRGGAGPGVDASGGRGAGDWLPDSGLSGAPLEREKGPAGADPFSCPSISRPSTVTRSAHSDVLARRACGAAVVPSGRGSANERSTSNAITPGHGDRTPSEDAGFNRNARFPTMFVPGPAAPRRWRTSPAENAPPGTAAPGGRRRHASPLSLARTRSAASTRGTDPRRGRTTTERLAAPNGTSATKSGELVDPERRDVHGRQAHSPCCWATGLLLAGR